jgi:drug/metabolite transporter (DMT)-like permease
MIVAAFAFATMSAVAHGFKGDVAWAMVSFSRIGVTWCMMAALMWWRKAPLVVRGSRALWVRSITGTFGLMCIFFCLSRLPVTDTVTILATSPVWVTVILRVVYKQPAPLITWLHVGLAVAGVWLMHRPTFDSDWLPLVVVMVAAVIVAVVKISLSFCRQYNPLSVVFHYATISTLLNAVAAFVFTNQIIESPNFQPSQWLWLLPMGLAGTFGQIFMTHAYGRGNTTMVAVVGIIQIVFAAGYDILVYGYHFDLLKVLGIACIVVAIVSSVLHNARAGSIAAP